MSLRMPWYRTMPVSVDTGTPYLTSRGDHTRHSDTRLLLESSAFGVRLMI